MPVREALEDPPDIRKDQDDEAISHHTGHDDPTQEQDGAERHQVTRPDAAPEEARRPTELVHMHPFGVGVGALNGSRFESLRYPSPASPATMATIISTVWPRQAAAVGATGSRAPCLGHC